jgi:hypothetical protein
LVKLVAQTNPLVACRLMAFEKAAVDGIARQPRMLTQPVQTRRLAIRNSTTGKARFVAPHMADRNSFNALRHCLRRQGPCARRGPAAGPTAVAAGSPQQVAAKRQLAPPQVVVRR